MEIDLQELNSKDEILINTNVCIPSEMFENTDIVSMDSVFVSGTIKYDYEDNYLVNLEMKGRMHLHDAIDYSVVPYDFSSTIEEKLENSLKKLDLIEFLWHYIVLEIPLRWTQKTDITEIDGDGYRVISEGEYKNINNPFKDFFKE